MKGNSRVQRDYEENVSEVKDEAPMIRARDFQAGVTISTIRMVAILRTGSFFLFLL